MHNLTDSSNFKGFYPNLYYDRVNVFFFFKQKSENCLKRVLPEGLLDYQKEKNVVRLTDEAFDFLTSGEAKLSLFLDDNSLVGDEKILTLPQHQRDGKLCDCDAKSLGYDSVHFALLRLPTDNVKDIVQQLCPIEHLLQFVENTMRKTPQFGLPAFFVSIPNQRDEISISRQ